MNQLLDSLSKAAETDIAERDRARFAELLKPKCRLPAVDYDTAQRRDGFAVLQTQSWSPLSSRRIVATEGLVAAAVMLYFLGGMLAVFVGL